MKCMYCGCTISSLEDMALGRICKDCHKLEIIVTNNKPTVERILKSLEDDKRRGKL